MEERKLVKDADAALTQDYEQAVPFGKVRVGRENLFWKKLLSRFYIPMGKIVRIYRRVEEVKGRTGCCSNDFSVHKLMVETKDGQLHEILIGESLYRNEPELLMNHLQETQPGIIYRKN